MPAADNKGCFLRLRRWFVIDEAVSFALESSISLCGGNRGSRGTVCEVWLEAVSDRTLPEERCQGNAESDGSLAQLFSGCMDSLHPPKTRSLCRAGTAGLACARSVPTSLSTDISRQEPSFHHLSDSSDKALELGTGFSSEKMPLTPLPRDFLYYNILVKAFRVGLHLWARC